MTLPMEETKTWRLRWKIMEVCASVTPEARRSSSSTAVSSESCSSTLTENGSIWQGETQVASCFCFGRERDVVFLGEGAGAGDVDGQRGRGFDAGAGEIVGSGETPAAIGQHADSDADRFVARNLAGLAVLGAELAVATFDEADVGVSDARAQGRIERFQRKLLHESRIAGRGEAGLGIGFWRLEWVVADETNGERGASCVRAAHFCKFGETNPSFVRELVFVTHRVQNIARKARWRGVRW